MPSPIGHILGGMIARELVGAELSLTETAVLSIAPDLDFLAGMADDQPGRYHGTLSHSIAAAITAGLVVALIGGGRRGYGGRALGATLVYGSHLLLDALGKEQEDGMPLIWPLSRRPLSIPGSTFRTIHRKKDAPFYRGLIHRGNRKAVLSELRPLLPIYLVVRLMRKRG